MTNFEGYKYTTEILETANNSSIIFAIVLAAFFSAVSADASARALQEGGDDVQKVIRMVGSEITHNIVTENTLGRQIEFLTDTLCEGRATGSRGAVETAFWIERQFAGLGILPFGESYSRSFIAHDGRIGRNLIGLLPSGGKKSAKPYIIIAAHYDGLGILDGAMYPGADSNASGVAAMLGSASMIGAMMRYGKVYGKNIIFVALDGKHLNMRGAQELWNTVSGGSLKDPASGTTITADDIMLMVNLDQIGSSMAPLHEGNGEYLIMLSDARSDFYRSSLTSMNSKYKIGLDLGFDYYGSRDFTRLFYSVVSEQKVFIEHGKPAVMFTSGITMNNNKTRDTASTLDLGVLKKRVWLLFHWLERVI